VPKAYKPSRPTTRPDLPKQWRQIANFNALNVASSIGDTKLTAVTSSTADVSEPAKESKLSSEQVIEKTDHEKISNGLQVRALFEFNAEEDKEELDLKVGDVILVLDWSHNEWWMGEKPLDDGSVAIGYFPASFVELIDEHQRKSEDTNVEIDNDSDVWKWHAKVLYDYERKDPNELSLKCGDIVTIYQPTENDWLEVEDNSGNVGFFPRSYCKLFLQE